MSLSTDTGGIPTINDTATAITIQQTVGGASRGASSAVFKSPEEELPTLEQLRAMKDKELRKFARDHGIDVKKPKIKGQRKKDIPKQQLLKSVENIFYPIHKVVAAEHILTKEELEAKIPPKSVLPPQPLPVEPQNVQVGADAGDEEKEVASKIDSEVQTAYNEEYAKVVAENAGKYDEAKMRAQLVSQGIRDKSTQDLYIQRQISKNLGLPVQDADKRETDYNREQLLKDLKPRQLLDDNVLLPLQPKRMSDGGPSFRYGSELATNLDIQKRVLAGTKIISRNVVEHFEKNRQKIIEKVIESKDSDIKNMELAKLSDQEKATLSIQKAKLIPQSQSLGYTQTNSLTTRRGPEEFANYNSIYVGGWN
jgi:hypothetical protein